MEQALEQIREQQKATWNKFSAGWKKWDDFTMDFLKPMGDEIVQMLKPKGNEIILDIASGTGEPGLTIASMLDGGKVILTDISEDMLEVAEENAEKKGITNIETLVCDVCELPYPDNTFDAVSCRFGFMFFPDMLLAAKEMARVLKPGGRMATSVWSGPEKNFWVMACMSAINKNMEMPAPAPGAPGMFRCAKDGFISDLFAQAGLKNISEKEVSGVMACGTADAYWTNMNDIAAPVVAALSKADDATKAKIKADVYEALHQRFPDGNVMIPSAAHIIYGEK